MNKLFLLISFLFFSSVSLGERNSYSPEQFFENLSALCGNSYSGEIVYPSDPPEGFEGQLVAHFTVCEDDRIHIPFHVGENKSRTWMLTLTHSSILFKHDHRYPDGTPEEMTNYGG